MGISRQQALECFRSDDLIGIGMEADAVRRRLHPEDVVSYAIQCAVSIPVGMDATNDASFYAEIARMADLGSSSVRLVNHFNSGSKTSDIEGLVGIIRDIRQRFSSLWLEALSPAQILALVANSGLDLQETLVRLHNAGLDSIASDSSQPAGNADWLAVHRAAHALGMPTVATMVFGAGETLEQRVDILQAIRQLQQETGGFAAFVPLPAEPASGRELDAVTAVEQMKTLAIARIFLDSIENIQWSGSAQGLKLLQTGLRFGANDAGSITPDDSSRSEEDLRRIIRDAGFQPTQRNAPYRTMFLN